MFKILIIISLIIKTCSSTRVWTWDDYPSFSENGRCHVSKPTYVCDPDKLLTDEQRQEIVDLVEDFKEKTKRPNSIVPCMREGLRLVVAYAKYKITDNSSSGRTDLCSSWRSSDNTICDSDMHGIELNEDGFSYCYSASRWLMPLRKFIYEDLSKLYYVRITARTHYLVKYHLKDLGNFYRSRFSEFDNIISNENNIKLSEVQHSLQDTKKTLAEIQQTLDQQNKTLTNFHVAIEETNKKLSEIRQLLTQDQMINGKNITMEEEKE
ncbi:unnamed protein product [Meloidogyne enterolobii]|uniref:Uncharacterized protein n=1 Tax=Meloidogyne enterolobii TaxID=390850 RepID=A0ACB1A2C7_MELEN